MAYICAMQFTEALARRINAAGSQKALAAELGISQTYLSEIVRGVKEPGPAVLDPLG